MFITVQDSEERERFWWDDAGWEMTFVENMRMLRERRAMSQTEFAKHASERGLSFHQPTVQRIENGQRPLKLTEALVIADLLGSTLEQMMHDTSLPNAYAMLRDHTSWDDLEVAFHALRREQGVQYRMKVIREDLDDYLAAAGKFDEKPDPALLQRVDEVLERLQRVQEIIDQAGSTIDEVVSELRALPPLPVGQHGGTPWDDV